MFSCLVLLMLQFNSKYSYYNTKLGDTVKNKIQEEMIQEFKSLTPKEGRQMIKAFGVFLLFNWDIIDTLVFNSIIEKMSIED